MDVISSSVYSKIIWFETQKVKLVRMWTPTFFKMIDTETNTEDLCKRLVRPTMYTLQTQAQHFTGWPKSRTSNSEQLGDDKS